MSDSILFDSQFTVKAIDPDGKKFDRVSRIVAHSSSLSMDMSIDIATDIYPVSANQNLTVVIASTLGRGDSTEDSEAWRIDKASGLADEYDYVMYGKVYRYDDSASDIVTVYASFGGLLLALTGSYRHLSNLAVGSNVYLLIR
ncbi:RNA polymerase [Meira miltonrushii]|uniref:DNA-directed RNA polymerases I, II, and III subunit RPABC3 n=1 Tax=Meira miltonrushii TaxID=1280837 RepID=A0A316VG19_9BASI|nr:RNA polymerase [Meira miltonrushii]PWN35263.1 RNA polymerase [Meira miltonrushii]